MAKQIVRKIKFDFNPGNLQQILKQIDEIKPVLKDSDLQTAAQLQSQIKTIMDSINTNEGMFSESGIKMISEQIEKIIKSFMGLTKKFELDPEIMKKQDELLEKEARLTKEIAETRKKIRDLQKETVSVDGDGIPRASNKVYQSFMPEGAKSARTGADLVQFSAWEKGLEDIQIIFQEMEIDINNVNEKFAEGAKKTEQFSELAKQLGVSIDFEEAKKQFNLYYEVLGKGEQKITANTKEIEKLTRAQDKLESETEDLKFQVGSLNYDMQNQKGLSTYQKMLAGFREEVLSTSITTKDDLVAALDKLQIELKGVVKPTEKADKAIKKLADGPTSTVGKAAKNIITYGTVYNLLRRAYRETIKTITELDKALTDMAVVTTMSRQEAWKLTSTFQDLARQTGMTTTEIANLSTTYFRQGRALKDVIELTKIAAKSAKIAGISAQESANYLTAAINGFGLAAREAEAMSDKFAALAASSASSYEELAVGLSKFASQANLAGLSVDFALGMLAKGVETTREAPESIGTALKTVLARMRELTDLGKTMEDGMDVNRVDTALRQIGVRIRDASGEFRDMESVLTEVGNKWNTLTKNQQANVAVALAGTRQQSRLIAMFQDFDRTLDLVETSLDSEGAMMAQHMDYMDGMEASMVALTTAWQGFISSIVESDVVIGIVKAITGVIQGLSNMMGWLNGFIGKVVIGMGMLLVTIQAIKTSQKIIVALKEKEILLNSKEIMQKTIHNTLMLVSGRYRAKQIVDQTLGLALTKQQIVADAVMFKAKIIGFLASTAAAIAFWAAATLGLSLLLGGLKKVWEGVKNIFNSIFKRKEMLEKENQELKKQRYELNQIHKKSEDIYDEYYKIQNTMFRTEADIAREEEFEDLLKEQLDALKEQGYTNEEIVYTTDGRFDLETNIRNLKEAQEKVEQAQKKNAEDLLQNARDRYAVLLKTKGLEAKDIVEFAQKNKEAMAIANRNSSLIEDLDPEYRQIYYELESSFLSDKTSESQVKKALEGQYRSVFESFGEQAKEVFDFKKILIEEEDFSEQLNIYKKGIQNLSKEQQELINKEFQALKMMSESYGKYGENILEGVDISHVAGGALSQKLGLAETQKMFNDIAESMEKGVPRIEAWSEAINKYFNEDDIEGKNLAWEFATRDVNKLITSYDALASRAGNASKNQKEFLEGTMSMTEAKEFLENYGDLLSNDEAYDKLKNNGDLSLYYARQILEERMGLEGELEDLLYRQNILGEEGLTEDIRKLELLLMYKGEFANLTQSQINYNSLKQRENVLSRMGLLDEQKELEIQKERREGALAHIEELNKKATSYLDNINEFTKDFEESAYTIIDGVAVVNTEVFEQLDDGQKTFITNWIKDYNDITNQQLEMLWEYMDKEIKTIEEANKKKKESYEKYFKALDRLEQKRDRKLTRDQIVQQLQRLEGASDERSRQKAKELRKELNDLDAQAVKDDQKLMREDMIKSLDDELEKRKAQMAESAQLFLDSIEEGGEKGAKAFAEMFKNITFNPETGKFELPSEFAKGGFVDYTGLAMLHGSKSRPEAVLSADQTVAFKQMAESLSSQKNFSSPDGVTIGSISIQTNSMNNNQDFKAAGRALAREFEAAIKNRGIGVNTKR